MDLCLILHLGFSVCVTAQGRFSAERISMLSIGLATELNQPTGAYSLNDHFILIPHYRHEKKIFLIIMLQSYITLVLIHAEHNQRLKHTLLYFTSWTVRNWVLATFTLTRIMAQFYLKGTHMGFDTRPKIPKLNDALVTETTSNSAWIYVLKFLK